MIRTWLVLFFLLGNSSVVWADYVQGDWKNPAGKVYELLEFDGAGNAVFTYKQRVGKSAIRVVNFTYMNIADFADVPGSKSVDLTLVNETLTTRLDEDTTSFNSIQKCGFNDWATGVSKDIQGTLCTHRLIVGQPEFVTVKKIHEIFFYMGEFDRYYDGTQTTTRPRNLNLSFGITLRRLEPGTVPPFLDEFFNNLIQ